jgi:two-component system sensor histidine kinase and response regulator WspE
MSDDLSGFSMLELFRTEVESQAAVLASGLLALEGPDASPATIEPMMRAAHSIKGAARIVGQDAAVQVAHVMEDCFVAAQCGQIKLLAPHVDVLLRGVDLLVEISQVPEDQSAQWLAANRGRLDAMVADLRAIQGGGAPATEFEADRARAPTSGKVGPTSVGPETLESAEAQARLQSDPPKPFEVAQTSPASAKTLEGPSSPAAATSEPADRVVRVTADSLTRLMDLAGETLVQARQLRPLVDSLLALRTGQAALWETLQDFEDRGLDSSSRVASHLLAKAKRQTSQSLQVLNEKLEQLEDYARRHEDLSTRLHHEVIASRMRPFADGTRAFARLVRDLARRLGRQARFEVIGEQTGVDRDILERLEAPLNHLIRNALDHGIEPPDQRAAAGKPESGQIRLEAHHRAGMLHITLSDDGRGIDPEHLRRKIVERGLVSAVMAEQLNEAELMDFLFLPGFSTAAAVTEFSGRGVGLDVVLSMVQAVGGAVRVTSRVGRGTSFHLQLPITLSMIRALLVQIAGEPYAFPLTRIDRILSVALGDLRLIEGRQHALVEGQPVGLVEAAQVLELPRAETRAEPVPVVVISDRGHRFGLVVDKVLGERDLQVRPLDARLGKVQDVSSVSVLDDGSPVLILDVEDLVRSIDNLLGGRRLRRLASGTREQRPRVVQRILVVDDSITVRELERQLLESRGYAVETAVDGVDGWNAVRTGDYQLVVTDVDMPRMDGIQLVRHIKDDARLRSLPVVIVSYKDREEDRMRGLDAGANGYLTKSSFHDQTFLDMIVDLIGEPRG